MEVEREVIDLYRAFFLRDRVGDLFEGVISGVAGFGIFVVIDHPFVEGLVRIEALSDDYYNFDEAACRLVGRRSGRTFALGDSVAVEVQSVSVVRRKIDFALAKTAGAPGGERRQGRGRDRGRDRGQGRGQDRKREGKRHPSPPRHPHPDRRGGKPSPGNRPPKHPKKKKRR
jgi:ribonuclease R